MVKTRMMVLRLTAIRGIFDLDWQRGFTLPMHGNLTCQEQLSPATMVRQRRHRLTDLLTTGEWRQVARMGIKAMIQRMMGMSMIRIWMIGLTNLKKNSAKISITW